MEEDENSRVTSQMDDPDDLLGSISTGIDDEGIVNFLSDAIGKDVGTEVLREFSHSEAFAELLDVVTSSLIPSGATSRRQSNQDSEVLVEGADPNQSDKSEVLEPSDLNKEVKTLLPGQNSNIEEIAENQNDVVDITEESTKHGIGFEETENREEDSCTPSQKDKQIQNRLKICLKLPFGDKKKQKSPKKILKKDNVKDIPKVTDLSNEVSPDRSRHKISPDKQSNVDKTANTKMKKSVIKYNQRLHKKCLLIHCDEEFKKYSATLQLNPCCVILCDLLNMGSAFRETNCLGGGGDASLSFVSVKNIVFMTEAKVEETHTVEKMKRRYFAKKLAPSTEMNIIKAPNLLSPDIGSGKRNSPQVNTKASDRVDLQISKKQENKATDTANKHNVVTFEEPRKIKKEVKPAEVDDDIDEDNEIEESRPSKLRHKSDERHSRGHETEASSTENDAKDKNHQFGRQREIDDVRARKFDKFEYERKRKLTERKGEKIKKEIKAVFKPHDPFRQSKTLLANSFKIPKKNTYDSYVKPEDLKVSTPLAKQEIPSENLKFQRCKEGKEDEKDTSFKKREWTPRNTNRRFENRAKMELDFANNDKPVLPPLELKPEIEPTWEDEPEGGGSIFGDRSTDSPLAPLSEVQAGDLAVEVTELLRDGSKVEIPSMEDFACATDTTAQKCAWWFTKTEKEPPVDEDCHMPNLDALSFKADSDKGSNCSFLGNVSNPGTDADCQVNEISSTNWCDLSSETVRDPDKVDEYCGRSLLQAKIRTGSGESFQNIFDLRAGALYEKENFQAKCNLCNQLIVGRRELAVHVRGSNHKDKLRKIDPEMGKSDDIPPAKDMEKSSKEEKGDVKVLDKVKVKDEPKNQKEERDHKSEKDSKDGKSRKGEKVHKDGKEKDRKDKKSKDKSSKKNGRKGTNVLDQPAPIKKEPVEMVFARTSSGLEIKVPVLASRQLRSRSPLSRTRSRSRNRSRSRSRERRRRKSRSPIRRIPRSPSQYLRNSRRSRSRSPSRGARKRRTSSEEKVNAFLARTRRTRSRSPANGYHSKRNRRSRTRSRSPQIAMKKDNREFHEKLALTADGKWNDEMEKQWKLMEAEEAMFREQFIDRRKALIGAPEEHPKYGEEWREFWERRYQEVEQSGKDPDSYDYVTEWKEYWSKRLNSLLQDEADAKIAEIKKNYGMDFASLNKLRNANTSVANPIVKAEPIEPIREAPPAPLIVKREILGTPGNGSDRASLDDFAIRSMSMSDGDNDSVKHKGVKQQPDRKPSVTIEDFKSKWELLTRQKVDEEMTGSLTDGLIITPARQDFAKRKLPETSENIESVGSKRRPSKNRSDVASSSEASYDFDGFDLAQVLRLMCNLEDQLSFLAPKVMEYFKMAEEMELAKSRGSHTLLDNQELVTVLFQSRDRFMTMIRSNVLSKDVLKSLNLTVYALNAILDAPQCQKFRLQVPVPVPELEKPIVEPKKEVKEPEVVPAEEVLNKETPVADSGYDIELAIASIPFEQKKAISIILAKYLLDNGRQNISDKGLKEFVEKMLAPALRIQASQRSSGLPTGQEDNRSDLRMKAEVKVEYSVEQPPHYVSDMLVNEHESHSASSRLYSVTSSRVVGSALPSLPAMSARAVEPRVPPSYLEHHGMDPHRIGGGLNTSSGSGFGRESRRSPPPSGRRSPFSRRDYTGNPVANPSRL